MSQDRMIEALKAADSQLSYIRARGGVKWNSGPGFDLSEGEVDQTIGLIRSALAAPSPDLVKDMTQEALEAYVKELRAEVESMRRVVEAAREVGRMWNHRPEFKALNIALAALPSKEPAKPCEHHARLFPRGKPGCSDCAGQGA